MSSFLRVLDVICTALGALVLYVFLTGALASAVIQWVKRRGTAHTASLQQVQDQRGAGWADLPDWVARDRGWAVASVLLGAPDLTERTRPFVDFTTRRIDWLGLRLEAAGWSRRERLIIDIAHDLVIGGTADHDHVYPGEPVTVADLLVDLDQPHLDLVHAAVDLRRGACTLTQARRVADQLNAPTPPASTPDRLP